MGGREGERIRSEVHKTILLVCKIKSLFNFPLECAIRTVQVNQDGLKLNCIHQLLVCAGGIHTWADVHML